MSIEGLYATTAVDFTTYRPKRAGVIPWTSLFGIKLYCLGVDTRYQELTDFGGGVNRHDGGDARTGAAREFREESLGVFAEPVLETGSVACGQTMAIFFVEYPELNPHERAMAFQERVRTEALPEVSDLVWVTEAEFKQLLAAAGTSIHPEFCRFSRKTYCMYERVRQLLARTGLP